MGEKLVRDNIPDIIRQNGETPKIRRVEGQEYKRALFTKLKEETDELIEAFEQGESREKIVEELADVKEVLNTLINLYYYGEVEDVRKKKRKERGGFEGRIILEGVEESPDENSQKTTARKFYINTLIAHKINK